MTKVVGFVVRGIIWRVVKLLWAT